jgi:hypothetical protein
MFGISLLTIAAATVNLLLAYLAVYVTLHPPDSAKRKTRKRQFILFGIASVLIVVGQEMSRKHEEAAAAALSQKRADQETNLVPFSAFQPIVRTH